MEKTVVLKDFAFDEVVVKMIMRESIGISTNHRK